MKKLGLLAVCALFLAVGCTKKTPEGAPATSGAPAAAPAGMVLKWGNGSEPADLDPQVVTGVPESHLMDALFEGLVGPDPKTLAPVPGVAESWTVSPDLKTYTFKIRANAKWSNGEPVTAQDFEYSWMRILSPALASEYSYMLFYVQNAEKYSKGEIKDFAQVGAKAVDAQTFQVTLTNPTPFFLNVLQHSSTFPVHRATIEKFGKIDQKGTQWTRVGNIVGNGPFTLKTWELNKIIVVEKSKTYWDAATVKLDAIEYYPVDDTLTEEKMFRSGQIHLTSTVPLPKIEVYQKENPDLIRIDPYLGTYYYRFNVTKKPLDNKMVRMALTLAIDRKAICDEIVKGGKIPALSYTPIMAGYQPPQLLSYDVEKAKKLLTLAGYPEGKGLPMIEIMYNTNEAHKVIAEAIQQMWKKNLNINVQMNNQEWKVYLANQQQLNYQVSRAGWIGDYADPNTFLDMFLTGGGNNQTGWSNKDYDRLIGEAAQATDPAKRMEIFAEAERILLDEVPVLPIYSYTNVYLKSLALKGWEQNILDHHPLKHVSVDSAPTPVTTPTTAAPATASTGP